MSKGNKICTLCGKNPVASLPNEDYGKRVQLCAKCVPLVVRLLFDAIDTTLLRSNYLNRLSKYGQK